MSFKVYRLSMLDRDTSRDTTHEGTGFLGMVNAVDGRESKGSDLDLTNAGGGNVKQVSSSDASSNSGNGGSSFPGK